MNIFVFGSNLAGRHGKGTALYAYKHHSALYDQNIGRQKISYTIPTKDSELMTLPLWVIEGYVKDFILYAKKHPKLTFQLTRIGCGLAEYKDTDIAPMFKDAPNNVIKPIGW